jgi:predicted aspartyl protease
MTFKNVMLFCLASTLASAIQAQTAAMPAAAEPSTVATGTDPAERMTVPVFVNGQGPFQFAIDTGADRTVISTELAKQLALPEAGKARLHAMGGQAMVQIVALDRIQISNRTLRNLRVAALPSRNLGADGLIGIDSLKGQRMVMDFVANTLKVEPSDAAEPAATNDGSLIVVTAQTRLGQLVMVDADANGQKIWVVVDSGAQNSVGNIRLRQLLLRRNPATEIKPVEMFDVLGRSTLADYTIVKNLRIGGIKLQNPAIAFVDAHPFKLFGLSRRPSMLLGMEGLRLFRRVSVDFASRKVKFLLPPES